MATVTNPLSKRARWAFLPFALAMGLSGALAAGDLPPETRERPPASAPAGPCAEPKSQANAAGTANGAAECGTPQASGDARTSADKTRSSRPDRYGLGYEARHDPGRGARRGRGGR